MRFPPKVPLIALAALGGFATPVGAEAGQYSCQIPAALLCEGCARNIEISLLPGGVCRVSFNAASAAAGANDAAVPVGKVDIRIQTPPSPPRRMAAYTRPRVALARRSSGRSCFLFNGHEYCE
jgi:hypothetical protein